jgi:hypothetical protein
MLMAVLTRRLQVLLDEQRAAHLEALAAQRGTTVAALVREALDAAFPVRGMTAAEAADRFLSREPMEFGEWTQLKTEIVAALDRGLPR